MHSQNNGNEDKQFMCSRADWTTTYRDPKLPKIGLKTKKEDHMLLSLKFNSLYIILILQIILSFSMKCLRKFYAFLQVYFPLLNIQT